MWTSWPRRLTTIVASMVGVDRERLVGVLLEPDLLAAPVAAVGGDQDLGPAVVDPAGQRLGREATEDDRVRRPDPGAGEHRDRQLGDHRHVDRDPVAGLDAELLERVGRLADLALEVAEGQRPGVARLADPVVGDLVAEAALDVPVDAVVGDVELAAGEPLRERQVPFERRLERRRPVEPLARPLRPERLEVGLGLGVEVGRARWPGRRRPGPAGRSATRRGGSRSRATGAGGSTLTGTLVVEFGWPGHPTAGVRRFRDDFRRDGPLLRAFGEVVFVWALRARGRRGASSGHALRAPGISMPFASNAARRRLRKSPAAAHWSAARTVPRILSVTPYSASACDAIDPRRLEDTALPDRVGRPSSGRPRRRPRSPCRCRCRRRPSRPG